MSMNFRDTDNGGTLDNSLAFRRALGNYLTGVTVVTTVDEFERPRGITANSFTSVSLDPPLVLVCIAKNADSYDAFVSGDSFTVNILADSQRSLSQLFASKSADKFDAVRWHRGDNGAPVLDDSLAWFDCRMYRQTDAGDHAILIGEVTCFDTMAGQPLGYCQGNYLSFGLIGNAVEHAAGARVDFGCIVNDGNNLLLCRADSGSPWSVPLSSFRKDSSNDQKALLALLHDAEIEAELSFLYSMFEVPETGETHIVYRGDLRAAPNRQVDAAPEFRLFSFDDIPWNELASTQMATMLRRYVREQASDSFSIYMDGVADGRLARLSGTPEPWRD
ncbi:MAG TPA: flavin reductase [Gammaproteobacteria bacterium]